MRETMAFNPGQETSSPLSQAISAQDRDTMATVRLAIERKWVKMAYQMVVSAGSPEQPAFCESLLRVLDHKGRIIPARDFLPIVEEDKMGRELDVTALEIGLDMLRQHPGLRLSINLSARSIGYSPWKSTLMKVLNQDRTIAERLVLEISEEATYTLPELVQVFMEEMQMLGISFALDHFGKGFTSLRHLRDLYFDIIKIDKTYTHNLANNPDNQAMIKAIVSMAHSLETYVVAQNVETREDAEMLINLGVDGMQGYFFDAPTLEPFWMQEGMCCQIAQGGAAGA